MAGGTKTHAALRPDWLALLQEDVLEPERPLIDAHMHLYDRPGARYLLPEFCHDTGSGHNIVASVYVQARSMYRTSGPAELQAVGETEFANGLAAQSFGPACHAAAIVGYVDLCLGDAAGPILDAHLKASPRLRGIRRPLAWDRDEGLLNLAYPPGPDLIRSEGFRAGFRQLAARGLSFDAWMFFHQLPALADLARDFPEVPIILNHCGGVLGIGPYAGRSDEVRATWLEGMKALSALPNLRVKLGGMGMRMCGFGLEELARPAPSEDLARLWEPYMGTAIELFGADRCMFETNFPVDKGAMSYRTCWNAYKRLASGASEAEKTHLFSQTAATTYRISVPTA